MKKLVYLGMGGTIAGRASSASDHVGYRAGEVPLTALLAGVDGLQSVLGEVEPVCEQVAQLDSKDMQFDDMARLAQRITLHLADASVQSVVVTHGTDTLEETAFFLECVLPADSLMRKAVVLTCAMRPATAQNPDGPGNLLDATALALDASARGLMVVTAGGIHSAANVQKVHPYRLDAFSSGDAGPLGYVEGGRVRWVSGQVVFAPRFTCAPLIAGEVRWPRVEIVMNHAGASGAVVRALCAQPAAGDEPVRGLVVAGTGNGTLDERLAAALKQAQATGVRVVRVSRCGLGVVLASDESSGALSTMPYSAVKARIALMLNILQADLAH